MNQLNKQDLGISIFIGILAGILIIPILPNIGWHLSSVEKILVAFGLMAFTPLGYLFAYWLSKWFPLMIQFVRFGIAGGLNGLIYLGVLNLLINATKITAGLYYSLFVSIAVIAAIINSYLWNKYWVFKAGESGNGGGEFIRFVLVNLVSFGISVGVASFVVNAVGAPNNVSELLWANIGAISAAAVTLFWNFFGSKLLVFKK